MSDRGLTEGERMVVRRALEIVCADGGAGGASAIAGSSSRSRGRDDSSPRSRRSPSRADRAGASAIAGSSSRSRATTRDDSSLRSRRSPSRADHAVDRIGIASRASISGSQTRSSKFVAS